MKRLLVLGLLSAISITTTAASVRAQREAPLAYVLDKDARSVTMLDVTSGAVVRTVSLQGSPTTLLRTADGKRLLALDRGAGKDGGDAGHQATARSAVTILDAATLAIQFRVELGWGLEPTPMLNGNGDRLSVICPGYAGRKADDTRPAEIVTVDLPAGKVVGRVALPRPATAFFGTPDGRTAVILSARDQPKQVPPLPAELRFVDLTGATAPATLPVDGDPRNPVLSPTAGSSTCSTAATRPAIPPRT